VVSDGVLLPYHQDDQLDLADFAVPPDLDLAVVEPTLVGDSQWERIVVLYDAWADRVAAGAASADRPLRVVTGDCLATVGTLVGLQRAGLDPCLVWFDAHGDVHTLASSTSGYLGGTALRMAVGGDPDRLGGPLGLRPLSEDRALLVDARDLDPAERAYLESSGIRRVPVASVDLGDLPAGPVLLHVDVDVVDPREIGGLRFPTPDGPASDEVVAAIGRLACSGRVVALDVACPWHPATDEDQRHQRTALLADLLSAVEQQSG